MMSGISSSVFSKASMPLRGLGDAVSRELQVRRVHLPGVLIVLDDEHERLVRVRRSSSTPRPAGNRSVNVEPLPACAVELDRAAEHLREPAANRQAKAGATVAARRRVVELTEIFEHLSPGRPSGMPTPVSRTAMRPASVPLSQRRSVTDPPGVNFSALLSRFRTICFTFWRSLLIGGSDRASSPRPPGSTA